MKIIAIQCPECQDMIYSRARHDFRCCSCGAIYVDGGLDYFRCGGKNIDKIKSVKIEVDASSSELYRDWVETIDKFGLIKGKKKMSMSNKKILSLKIKSRKKWSDICYAITSLRAIGGLTNQDCGYCQIYYDVSRDLYDCQNCPLGKPTLCNGGDGRAYSDVYAYYANFLSYNNEPQKALTAAHKILLAIDNDLLKLNLTKQKNYSK